ncbi:hypothetical protein FKW77_003548 [Venturia effusa]|uniref:Uncharacterized protein n=1 Tax=Venturia effusa TaxID=50376 RepID=A0A517KW22_9PEZI|nr:hypothetical protein FKW77_003548 [Venturia effusa]
MIYRYHLALIDYKLCKIEERADSRQQILALDEPLPPPNPAFRTSTGPGPSPQNSGPKVPQRSSLRAIAHFNSQHKQSSLNTKLSQVVKASKSLQEVGLEAASIPLPRSPSPEAKESNEGLSSSQHPNASVDVPVHLAPFHGRLPLRRYSSSDLDQEAQKFSPPDSAGNKALGTSPMLRKPTLMDLALKRSRAPPKKRPDPSAPIALPAQAVPPEAQSEPFSAVLDQTSWPVPPVSISRSASFSSSRQKTELVDSADIGRSLSLTSAHRRGDLIVPLENPRPAPLSPAQKKEDLASRDSGKKKSLQQGKEELVRKKGVTKEPSGQEIATQNSWKRATFHHQEKQDVVRHKNLKRMTHDEDKNMSARLKDLRRESSAKSALKVRTDLITPKSINRESSIRSLREKTDAVKLEGLNREFPTRLTPKESADLMRLRNSKREKSRSPISAGSFAENAKSFSTLAPSFRIGKTRPRPHNLTLKASALDPPDSPPLTSLTHSNWGDSNESKHNIAAPPPSPATLAASIKSNKKRLSLQRQKQRRAARAEAKAAKRAERERASREKVRKETLTPEAERYYTKSPYDFDSSDSPSSSSDDDEESDVSEFALDTNHVPGSASQHRFFANEAGNWSTVNHLGDSRAGGGDTPRSMSVYSHQGSQSVYSVDTNGLSNGLPPGLVVHKNGHTGNQGPDGLPRRPMSSLVTSILPPLSSTALMSPGARSVTPLFHRRSTDQLGVNSVPASPADHLAHEYEEEIGELEEEGAELIRLYEQGEEAWVG